MTKPIYFEALTLGAEGITDCEHDQDGPGVFEITSKKTTPYLIAKDQIADPNKFISALSKAGKIVSRSLPNCSKCGMV